MLRANKHTEERYAVIQEQRGLLHWSGSMPIGQKVYDSVADDSMEIALHGGGHRAAAFYIAEARNKRGKNVFIDATMDRGYMYIELVARTPLDVQVFFADQGNEFNGIASEVTFMELIDRSDDAKEALLTKCGDVKDPEDPHSDGPDTDDDVEEPVDKKARTVKADGDSIVRTDALRKLYPAMWATDAELKYCSMVKSVLSKFAVHEHYQTHCSDLVKFTHRGLDQRAVVRILYHICKTFKAKVPETEIEVTSRTLLTLAKTTMRSSTPNE